jgi:hypothetical protein
MTDQTEALRKYGVVDMARAARKSAPPEPLITPAEWAEIDRAKAERAGAAADAVYLGWPVKPPLHPDPVVCEVAGMLMGEFAR